MSEDTFWEHEYLTLKEIEIPKLIDKFVDFIDNILDYCEKEDRVVKSFIINIKNEKYKWKEELKKQRGKDEGLDIMG